MNRLKDVCSSNQKNKTYLHEDLQDLYIYIYISRLEKHCILALRLSVMPIDCNTINFYDGFKWRHTTPLSFIVEKIKDLIETNAAKNCCNLPSPNWWEKWKNTTTKNAAEAPTLVVYIEPNSIAIVLSSITAGKNFEHWTNRDDPMIVHSFTGYICRQP